MRHRVPSASPMKTRCVTSPMEDGKTTGVPTIGESNGVSMTREGDAPSISAGASGLAKLLPRVNSAMMAPVSSLAIATERPATGAAQFFPHCLTLVRAAYGVAAERSQFAGGKAALPYIARLHSPGEPWGTPSRPPGRIATPTSLGVAPGTPERFAKTVAMAGVAACWPKTSFCLPPEAPGTFVLASCHWKWGPVRVGKAGGGLP